MPERAALVDALLAKHGILNYRSLFNQEQYSKDTMPKGNDHLIKPFTLTAEEKSLPSGLREIAASTIHSRIAIFDERQMSVLKLETLKKKTVDVQSHLSMTIPLKKMTQNKVGEKKRRKVHSVSLSESDRVDESASQKKRARVGDRPIKRNDTTVSGASGEFDLQGSRRNETRIPPLVLQKHLEGVFKTFWELELDPSLATPFFGIITPTNCDALGLPHFFNKVNESCSLANISEKLKSGVYTSLESFEADFALMFGNILVYFDESSPQHKKAKELQAVFRDKWTNVLLDLKRL